MVYCIVGISYGDLLNIMRIKYLIFLLQVIHGGEKDVIYQGTTTI